MTRRQQMICESCGEEGEDEPTVTVYRPDCWDDCYTMSAMGVAGHPTEEWCLTCAIERIGEDWQNSSVVA